MGKNASRSVTLIGAGSLGQALATMLPIAGYGIGDIVVRRSSRRAHSVTRIARSIGARVVTQNRASWRSGIIWLAVSDSAIASCADSLVRLTDWNDKIVFHSSGALSGEELGSLKRAGASVASIHPMMTFVPGKLPVIKGVVWTVEGDARATSVARRIVRDLGGIPISINPKQKPLYHAFGAFLSPLLVVHLEIASQLALQSGIPRRNLASIMRPIVEQTLRNLFPKLTSGGGAGKAFSGPLVRGDVSTLHSHLIALKANPPARMLYLSLVSAALQSNLPIKNRSSIRQLMTKVL